jgi:hypothetical protein
MALSRWHVDASWGQNQTDVTINLQLRSQPGRYLHEVNQASRHEQDRSRDVAADIDTSGRRD